MLSQSRNKDFEEELQNQITRLERLQAEKEDAEQRV